MSTNDLAARATFLAITVISMIWLIAVTWIAVMSILAYLGAP